MGKVNNPGIVMERSTLIWIVVFLLLLFYTAQKWCCSKKIEQSTYKNYIQDRYNNGGLNYAIDSAALTSIFYGPTAGGFDFIGGIDGGGGYGNVDGACADGGDGGDGGCDGGGDGGDF